MAEAARRIIKSANEVKYGFLPDKWQHEERFVRDFLNGTGFAWLSPYLVVERRDDPDLATIHGRDCIEKLTNRTYENAPPDDLSGPLYLYKIQNKAEPTEEYEGLFIFGGASANHIRKKTFSERVESEQSTGLFLVLDPNRDCVPLLEWPISGRHPKQFVTHYTPRLAGIGYYNGQLIVYSLQSPNSPADEGQTYSFRWQFSSQWPTAWWRSSQHGSAHFNKFPDTFDSFSIINNIEQAQ